MEAKIKRLFELTAPLARIGRSRVAVALALLLTGCQQLPQDPTSATTPVARVAPGAMGTATVVRVIDGDTVVLGGGLGRARLIGIDTPEIHGQVECFGNEATEFANAVLAGRTVRYTVGAEPRDRYGRLLVYLKTRDGRSFNELVLSRGYGRPLAIRPNTRYAGRYRKLADQARDAKSGRWGACPQ